MSPLAAAWRKTVRASKWAVRSGSDEGWRDVWSRAGSKYRNRATVLLIIDLLLFTGLCLFTYWLRTGLYLPFHREEYFSLLLRSFQVHGTEQVGLADMLMWPISVERTPMHMVVLALVMAALVSVPILVSILYRFPFALPFAAMISIVAVMPWLGITAVFACALASLRPFRMSFRFGSALLALVPFAVYLWLSLKSGGGTLQVSSAVENFKLYAPWGMSLLAACFNFAVVLSLASLVGYRPGAIAPVLAILFAVPVVIFEIRIGQDELYYSVLETNHGPASRTTFRPSDIVQFVEQERDEDLLKEFRETYDGVPRPYEDFLREWRLDYPRVQDLKARIEELCLRDLEQDRAEAIQQAERFVADFPHSRRVPAALYLLGRAMDTQLDVGRLRSEGTITFYDDFPSAVSRGAWQSLVGSYGHHPLATIARYKLAVHALRQGQPDEALTLLQQVQAYAEQPSVRADPPAEGWFSLMQAPPDTDSLNVNVRDVAVQVRELHELVLANAGDRRFGAQPLAWMFRMDPHHQLYRENLLYLDSQVPGSLLQDNLRLRIVLTSPSVSVRIAELQQHLRAFAGHDSIPRAMYELGRLYEQDARFKDAMEVYEQIQVHHADSVWWTDVAAERLATLKLSLAK